MLRRLLEKIVVVPEEKLDRIIELLTSIDRRLAVAPPPPPVGVVDIGDASIQKLAKLIADLTTGRLERLPNRLERIDIDTSETTQISLRRRGKIKPAVALGFWVEDVGGGFTYIVRREGFGKDERTAVADDKWDQEFDDLLITGSGTAGTGKIWYWWIEPEKLT